MRRTLVSLAALASVTLLAACASTPGGPADETAEPAPASAADLVGLWKVSGVEGEQGTWLRLDGTDLQLLRDCGRAMGSWSGTDTLFLGQLFASDGGCAPDGLAADWLTSAVSYEADGDGWALLDGDGSLLALLQEDADGASELSVEAPQLTAETRELLATPAALPDDAEPTDLVGRWVPVEQTGDTEPFVEFTAGGDYTGSDGCNGAQGRWAADASGGMITTAGVSTLIGCDGAPVPQWVGSARSAGTIGDELVLFDAEGAELGRLVAG